ncbi:MAG: SIMPL domain-containing protein [Calditrichaeota bacterium]|nr:SIMPL domain-containing protein [Calditrichota bacterium]
MDDKNLINSLLIAVAIAFAGFWLGNSIITFKEMNRYVTVKGLAERTVDADLVIWPITFKISNNRLIDFQKEVEQNRQVIKDFLIKNGVASSEISYTQPEIRDMESEQYGNRTIKFRFVGKAAVNVRTSKVSLVREIKEKSSDLIRSGIVLSQEDYWSGTSYYFTSLNDIKPEMIANATKNAREAAENFAKDSGSKIGKLKNATQGFFSIEDKDKNSPHLKTIRVVSTLEYFLED